VRTKQCCLISYGNCIINSYWNKSNKKIATQDCVVNNTTIFKLPMYVAHNEIKDVIKGLNPKKVKLWTKIMIEIWPCKYSNLFSLTWLDWDKWLFSYNYWGGGVGGIVVLWGGSLGGGVGGLLKL
jgi:hypothetical protein